MLIESVDIRIVSFHMKRPFITAAGRKSVTRNVQVRVRIQGGAEGFGEASTSLAKAGESAGALKKSLRRAAAGLADRRIEDFSSLVRQCWLLESHRPAAVAALECALADAWAIAHQRPLWKLWGSRCRPVETDLTLSVAEPEALAARARAASRRGFRRFKVKLGAGSPRANVERVAAVERAVPGARIVADGNQGMHLEQAAEFAALLESGRTKIEFLEQPFMKGDISAMRAFRKKHRVPLVADESIHTAADALRLFSSGAADGVNVKVAKSGLAESLEIIRVAKKLRKILSIGCMEESRWGLAASVHLACGTGAFDWVDLDSAFLLEDGPREGGFSHKGPFLSVGKIKRGAGIP